MPTALSATRLAATPFARRSTTGGSVTRTRLGDDPLGDTKTADISKKQLDELLASGSVEAAGIVLSAIEDYAQALYAVLKRFLKNKAWSDTEAIVFGGGFRGSRIGELAIGRAGTLLKADDISVDLELIQNDPDEAGLIGAAHLLPAWMLEGYGGILTVDVGGTNIRAGIVELRLDKAKDLSSARVAESHLWRHADEKVSRTETIEHLTDLIQSLVKTAKKEKTLSRASGRHRMSRHHRGRWQHRAWRPEPARQLGEQSLQFSGGPHREHSEDRRP